MKILNYLAVNSTLLLLARPTEVELSPLGFVSPYASTSSLEESIPNSINLDFTDSALFSKESCYT